MWGGENIQLANLQVAKTYIVYEMKPLSAKIMWWETAQMANLQFAITP